jgi:murein DD-endopeptidase MepM/ murein hydrolase activator NlpD
MGEYQLLEYRPNRWIKVDAQAGVVAPATPQEVGAWLSTQKVEPTQTVVLQQAGAWPAPESGPPAGAAPIAFENPPAAVNRGDAHGAPQKPSPKPKPVEPTKPQSQGPVRPLSGRRRITSTFASHRNRKPPSTAPGIDFACPTGTEIRAWAAGRVVRSRWSSGGGRSLWIDHGYGIRTYYAHLNSLWVLEGETVAAGQKIGESGNTGHTTGPHLHFSVTHNGRYVDPAKYLPPEESGNV